MLRCARSALGARHHGGKPARALTSRAGRDLIRSRECGWAEAGRTMPFRCRLTRSLVTRGELENLGGLQLSGRVALLGGEELVYCLQHLAGNAQACDQVGFALVTQGSQVKRRGEHLGGGRDELVIDDGG